MSFFGVMVTVAVVVAAVGILMMIVQGAARSSLRSGAKDWLTQNNLTEYMVTFAPGDAIGLNYQTQQAGFSSGGRNFMVPFSSIVSVEISENGSTVSKTNRSGQLAGMAVGGVLMGGVGAVVGGLSASSSSRQKVGRVSINVITDRQEAPFIELKVFHDKEIDKGGFIYNQHTTELMPWYGRLKAIVETQAPSPAR